MKSTNSLSRVLLGIVLVSFAAPGNQHDRLTSAVLARDVRTSVSSKNVTTRDAFVGILVAARVPGGIVQATSCTIQEPQLQSSSLRLPLPQALDLIVRADPQYRWMADRGVVNLLPAAGEPDL